ncbi:hypothetical protein BG004_003111 [Podila humilis]|nr:hypothetical protein BG004_003111 [Podila humilis]
MQQRIQITLGVIAALALSVLLPSAAQRTRLDTIPPLLLGLLVGFLVAETPIASPIQELLGLTSRHPDKVGLDIIHGSSDSTHSDKAKDVAELDHKKPMYGLQHAFLNLEVTGWWFNMGLWDKTRNMRFQEACEALVDKVTSNVNITGNSHILDVGFGCGDQDVYMAQRYKPKRITGITIEPIQHHAAQELVKKSNLAGTAVDLHIADASYLHDFLDKTPGVFGPVGPLSTKTFSHVISIDSAYHYNTRAEFLKNAFSVLTPGSGHLALADMILAKPAPTSSLGRYIFEAVFGAMEVPVVNMKGLEEYKQDLVEAGFVDIEIECVEDRVFSGLADFIDGQRSRLGGLVKPGVNWTYWGLSKGLWWLDRSHWLHFVIVKARKP